MKYCVKTKDGEILPVWHGVTFDVPQSQYSGATHMVLTTKDKNAGQLLYKFVGPNNHYTIVCDEQGAPVEPPK